MKAGRGLVSVYIHDISEYVCLIKFIDYDKCDYKAARLDHLKAHKHIAHGGGNYNCDKRDYHPTRLGHLKTHKQAVHEVVIHNCGICD